MKYSQKHDGPMLWVRRQDDLTMEAGMSWAAFFSSGWGTMRSMKIIWMCGSKSSFNTKTCLDHLVLFFQRMHLLVFMKKHENVSFQYFFPNIFKDKPNKGSVCWVRKWPFAQIFRFLPKIFGVHIMHRGCEWIICLSEIMHGDAAQKGPGVTYFHKLSPLSFFL